MIGNPYDFYWGDAIGFSFEAKFLNETRRPNASGSCAKGDLRCSCDAHRTHFILRG
jgi:hypothetical protein